MRSANQRIECGTCACGCGRDWQARVSGWKSKASEALRERDEARAEAENLRAALDDPSKTSAGCDLIRGAKELGWENRQLRARIADPEAALRTVAEAARQFVKEAPPEWRRHEVWPDITEALAEIERLEVP